MRTPEDKVKQAQAEIDAALVKRARGSKLWAEAEEELIMAEIKMQDALKAQREAELRVKRLS